MGSNPICSSNIIIQGAVAKWTKAMVYVNLKLFENEITPIAPLN